MESNSVYGYSYLLRRHRSTPSKVMKIKFEVPEDNNESSVTAFEEECSLKVKRELLSEVTPPPTPDEDKFQDIEIITENINPQNRSKNEPNITVPRDKERDDKQVLAEKEKICTNEFETANVPFGTEDETAAPVKINSVASVLNEYQTNNDGQLQDVGEELSNFGHNGIAVETPISLLVANPFSIFLSSKRKRKQELLSNKMLAEASDQVCGIKVNRERFPEEAESVAAEFSKEPNSRFELQNDDNNYTEFSVNAHLAKIEKETPMELETVQNQIANKVAMQVIPLEERHMRDGHQPNIRINKKLTALGNSQHQFEIDDVTPITLLVENPFANFNSSKRKSRHKQWNNKMALEPSNRSIKVNRELLPKDAKSEFSEGHNPISEPQNDVQIYSEFIVNMELKNLQHQIKIEEETPMELKNVQNQIVNKDIMQDTPLDVHSDLIVEERDMKDEYKPKIQIKEKLSFNDALEKSKYRFEIDDETPVALLVENPFANGNACNRKSRHKQCHKIVRAEVSDRSIKVTRELLPEDTKSVAAQFSEDHNSSSEPQSDVQIVSEFVINAELKNLQDRIKIEEETPMELQTVQNQIANKKVMQNSPLDVHSDLIVEERDMRYENKPKIQINGKLTVNEALEKSQYQFETNDETPVTLLVENPFANLKASKRKIRNKKCDNKMALEVSEEDISLMIKRELLEENTRVESEDRKMIIESLDNCGLKNPHQTETEEMPIKILNAHSVPSTEKYITVEELMTRDEPHKCVQNNAKLIVVEESEKSHDKIVTVNETSITQLDAISVESKNTEDLIVQEHTSKNEQQKDVRHGKSIANDTPHYAIKTEKPVTLRCIHTVGIAENHFVNEPKATDDEQEDHQMNVGHTSNEDLENDVLHQIVSENGPPETLPATYNTTIKTKSCELPIKTEPIDVLETGLSEWHMCKTEPISPSIKQEYFELSNVQIPDVKEDAALDFESSPIMEKLYVGAGEEYDVKPFNTHATSSLTIVEVLSSQEENLLMPRPQSAVNEKIVAGKRNTNAKQKGECGTRRKSTLSKGRKQNNKKRRNRNVSYPRFHWSKGNAAITTEKRKTRARVKKQNTAEFPRPLKVEKFPIKSRRKPTELDIATVLPRPMVFKLESAKFNTKKPQTYRINALQPLVRIKRLNWNHLGVEPDYKPRMLSMTRLPQQFQRSLWNSNRDIDVGQSILIQNAFSLNPGVQANRAASSTHACNFGSSNESQRLLQAAMPEVVYMPNSRHCDSGDSTSSNDRRDNANILLEIAAERAFINHHLIRFGYSPVQFQLYNDFNDLSIFLKYLLGRPSTTNKK